MDSNQRPPDLKSGALPTELRIPLIIHYVYVANIKTFYFLLLALLNNFLKLINLLIYTISTFEQVIRNKKF